MSLPVRAALARWRFFMKVWAFIIPGILLSGCDEESGPNISGVPGFDIRWVEITPSVDTMFVADTVRLTDRLPLQATAYGVGSERLPVTRFVWTSSDTSIAQVNESGVVIPRRTGVVEIQASATRIGKATVVILPAAQRVDVVASRDTIFIDEPVVPENATLSMTARVVDAAGQLLTGTRIAWSVTPNTVATIDAAGTLRAIAPGSAVVVAHSETASLRGERTIEILPVVRSVTASAAPQVLVGDTLRVTAAATGYTGQEIPRTFRWASSNPSIATVDQNGQAIFVGPGTVTFTASTAYRSASVSVSAQRRELSTVASGRAFSCGLANLGRLYCWGRGNVGQLASAADSICIGDDDEPASNCAIQAKRASAPFQSYIRLAVSEATGCAISDTGRLFCWGSGINGTIGNGTALASGVPTPATVLNERFVEIAGGGQHFCALSTEQYAFCWGSDDFGQLGDTLQVNSTTPIPVVGPDGRMATRVRFSAIAAGTHHTCGVEAGTGQAWCWGNGASGQRGDGTLEMVQRPRRVNSSVRFRQLDAGGVHTCGVADDGRLFCWGSNASGQLGVPATSVATVPVLVGTGYKHVSAGEDFSCAITTGGSVNCWGRNDRGQLGRGEGTPVGSSSTPSTIALALTFRTISAGRWHACAIDSDNNTWCWGSNLHGALGNGLQAAMRAVPERIAPLR